MEPGDPDIDIRIVSEPTYLWPTWVVAILYKGSVLALGQHRRKRQAEFIALERALARLPEQEITQELTNAFRRLLRINAGSWLEWRLVGVFRHRKARRRPPWAFHLRRATVREEAEGIDLVLITPYGEITFQLKSTIEGIRRFLAKGRPRNAILIMHGERPSNRVLEILLHKAERRLRTAL